MKKYKVVRGANEGDKVIFLSWEVGKVARVVNEDGDIDFYSSEYLKEVDKDEKK